MIVAMYVEIKVLVCRKLSAKVREEEAVLRMPLLYERG